MSNLVFPSVQWKETYLSGLKEFLDEGLPVKVDYSEVAQDFALYVKKLEEKKEGKGLPPGYSPETELWLIDEDEYIGTVQIRHELNDVLKMVGGNIGYHIRPTKRKKGYGMVILSLALPYAKKIGIDRVLITCDETNVGSKKIIEANGGVLENSISNGEGKPKRLRYWIALS